MPVTADELQKLLDTHITEVAEVLLKVQGFDPAPTTLSVLKANVEVVNSMPAFGGKTTLAEELRIFLSESELEWHFMAEMQTATEEEPPPSLPAGEFNARARAEFLQKADHGFRLFVFDANGFCGVATLISSRLALTAWHVTRLNVPGQRRSDLSVRFAHSTTLNKVLALPVELPCHESQADRTLSATDISLETLRQYPDAALMYLERPMLTGCTLPRPTVPLPKGLHQVLLLHQQAQVQPTPEGTGTFAPTDAANLVMDASEDDPARFLFDVAMAGTSPGSSGAPIFDQNHDYVGFHQGILSGHGLAVPYAIFGDKDQVTEAIDRDRKPRFVYSTNGTVNGELVIGREDFCTAVHDVVHHEVAAKNLRGIWVRRLWVDETPGMEFTYEILRQMLAENGVRFGVPRFVLRLAIKDLYDEMALQILGTSAPKPRQGVTANQTSEGAMYKDQAKALVAALVRKLEGTVENPAWIYFDNPRGGLLDGPQQQLEILIQVLLHEPSLRFVLAGGETYALPQPQSDSPAGLNRPGIWIERIGDVRLDSLMHIVGAIDSTYGLGMTQPEQRVIADSAMMGRLALRDATHFQDAAESLRMNLRYRIDQAGQGGAP
ncbi:trypsin-like serine peptidase [Gymnodinialimonas sp.]